VGDPVADLAVLIALEESSTLNPYNYGNWELMFDKLLGVYQQDNANWVTLAATPVAVELVEAVAGPGVPIVNIPEDPEEDADGLDAALDA
jgi:hypothetical protein